MKKILSLLLTLLVPPSAEVSDIEAIVCDAERAANAVGADIVSPLLLIVVAASGLGGFCVPSYALSVGMKIIQLLFLTAGALGGLYLMALLGLALLCAACAMRSVGSPLTAPLTPRRPGNPDLLIRFPLWRQKARAFFAGRKD